MEPLSPTCAAVSLTCGNLALLATGLIIISSLALFLLVKRQKVKQPIASKEKNPQREDNFSLLLITTSPKLRGKIDIDNVTNGEYNQSVGLEIVKNLINTSRYFLIDNTGNGTLQEAKTSTALPDLEKDNLFILKITGKGQHDIATCKTKLGLRDSITSETCKIEKVLYLLDARVAEKFIPTI